ncbi:MAG: paraquat-inducible protein A [Candidatus Omnitrophica bacterium]|nr:paraquat-inducible protein A [Candidatus Omnitrophota bacterium]
MSNEQSLHKVCGFQPEIYLCWLASAAAFSFGLTLPVIKFTEMMIRKSSFSIISGAQELLKHGEYVLAGVIILFSVVFPIFKLLGLMYLWFATIEKKKRTSFLKILGSLGKWSMLDVYVVALTVVIAKSSLMAKAEPQIGIYLFGAAVVLSIIVSIRIEHLSKTAFKLK